MFKSLTTLQRVLFCIALTNLSLFGLDVFITQQYDIHETHFVILGAVASVVNFVWIWLLLRKAFKTVEVVTQGMNQIASDDKVEFESSGNYKIHIDGHQKEVTDLVKAFNTLVEDIHQKAQKSHDIIDDVNNDG